MSDFYEGRVAATFQVGHRIEDTKEVYEKEIVTLEGMKSGLLGSARALEAYGKQIQKDGIDAKIPVKESDIAVKYVATCIEIIQKLIVDAEAKRLAAFGAVEALKKVVADVKSTWDKEQLKLKEIKEFESQTPKDIRTRPVGYMPKEHPLELTQQGDDESSKAPLVKSKRNKKA